jgi:hypothetical protein
MLLACLLFLLPSQLHERWLLSLHQEKLHPARPERQDLQRQAIASTIKATCENIETLTECRKKIPVIITTIKHKTVISFVL